MPTNFQINGSDFNDVYIRRDLFSQGGLWVWGFNNNGELGDNTIVNKSSPVQITSGGTNWKMVSSGNYGAAAIKTDGTLWTWGYGVRGGLGNNTNTNTYSPVQTISGGTNWKMVAGGGYSTLAIKTDGTLWTWGRNDSGQLGDNTVTDKSSPVQTVAGGWNWKQVTLCGNKSSIQRYHVIALKTDGTLWTWGENSYGQLGNNTNGGGLSNIASQSSPIQTISGGTNWKMVAGGREASAAIKTDGTLWTWGYNGEAQLGDNTTVDKSSPVQTISGGTNWKQIQNQGRSSAAIKTDGTLWTWGSNVYGNLGDNTTVDKSSPVQTVAGGTNWKQVTPGGISEVSGYVTAAIKTDNTLWMWGLNNRGQLGDNTIVDKSSPVQTISGGTNWKQVSVMSGTGSIYAIREDFY